MSFHRITEKEQIQQVMQAYMLQPDKQKAPFLATIFQKSGEIWNDWSVTPGGHIIEGARPFDACTEDSTGEITYSLTNSDSGYSRSIGSVRLSGIQYIELAP